MRKKNNYFPENWHGNVKSQFQIQMWDTSPNNKHLFFSCFSIAISNFQGVQPPKSQPLIYIIHNGAAGKTWWKFEAPLPSEIATCRPCGAWVLGISFETIPLFIPYLEVTSFTLSRRRSRFHSSAPSQNCQGMVFFAKKNYYVNWAHPKTLDSSKHQDLGDEYKSSFATVTWRGSSSNRSLAIGFNKSFPKT